jgi:hypothetical protein
MQIPLEYLTERTTYERAVSENLHDGRPFGHAHDDWERLKAKMQQGDELWYFAPPSQSVMQLWGLALVRRGQVVSTVLTAVD